MGHRNSGQVLEVVVAIVAGTLVLVAVVGTFIKRAQAREEVSRAEPSELVNMRFIER